MGPPYLPRPARAALLAAATLPAADGARFLRPAHEEISLFKGRHYSVDRLFSGVRTLQWIENQTSFLSDEGEWGQIQAKYGSEPSQLAGIVTHAGKRGGDYMDHAIMLGRSLSDLLRGADQRPPGAAPDPEGPHQGAHPGGPHRG